MEAGIFCTLHTRGRQLSQHPHIHASVTRGGLDVKHGVWRALFFKKKVVEEIWRGAVIRLLRKSYDLINPGSLPGLGHIRDREQWRRYLQAQYGRHWKVHFAKKTRGVAQREISGMLLQTTFFFGHSIPNPFIMISYIYSSLTCKTMLVRRALIALYLCFKNFRPIFSVLFLNSIKLSDPTRE
ncbi:MULTISPECIES: transposase [Enterobacter]|uniref:transposase n=1 Tax=unclassified Enterobacter TaxID=2608935 RepID=UPI001CBC3A78|nr:MULTISPECIES: transposase [Enterobacter]MCG7803983.1 transposase [Enterobacter asburiae]